jgi:hypothetical protein
MSSHRDGPDEPLAPLPIGALSPTVALPQTLPPWTHNSLLEMHHWGRRRAAILMFYPMDWEPVSREQLMLYQAYADAVDRLGARLLCSAPPATISTATQHLPATHSSTSRCWPTVSREALSHDSMACTARSKA